jgi:SAM-dependent methyltransferase
LSEATQSLQLPDSPALRCRTIGCAYETGDRATNQITSTSHWHIRVHDLIVDFLSRRNDRTFAAYVSDLDAFARFRDLSREDALADLLGRSGDNATAVALAYAVHLRRQGRATATVGRRLGTLRALARRARDAGLVGWLLDLPTDDEVSRAAMAMRPDVPYLFPPHETEVDRLDIQHYALLEALGGNYRAPIGRPARVLDVGCGSGQWAYDLCREFPDCLVVGFDLASPKPVQAHNFEFVQGNLLHGLPFADDDFDVVHQRLLAASAVPLQLWSSVVADLVRVTRPEGWVELVESAPEIESAGPATERLFSYVRQLGRSHGLDTTSLIVRSLGDHLTRAGLADVQSQTIDVPIGDWGGQPGSLLASGVRAGMTRLMDSFREKLGVPEVESRRLIHAMCDEWNRHRGRTRFAIAFGRKSRVASRPGSAGGVARHSPGESGRGLGTADH